MDPYARKPPQTFISVGSCMTFHTAFFFLCMAGLTLKPDELQNSALTSDNLS